MPHANDNNALGFDSITDHIRPDRDQFVTAGPGDAPAFRQSGQAVSRLKQRQGDPFGRKRIELLDVVPDTAHILASG
jgi:hypothetical protein